MKKRWVTSGALLLVLRLATIAVAQPSSSSAKELNAVRQAFNQLVAAFNAHDAHAAVAYFADDIVLVSPVHPDLGYQALKDEFTARYATQPPTSFTAKANIEEIQVAGDLAFIRVVWSRERNSDHAILSGEKDIESWQRQKNGAWKLARGYSFPLKPDAPNWTSGKVSTPQQITKKKADAAADLAAIKQALAQTAQAYNNRDLPLRMSFYATDSLLSYPGQPDADIARSKQNYGANFANLPPFPFRSFYEIEEIQTSGDLAFVRMMWFVERQSDQQIVSRLRDLEIWRRQADGSWKLARGLSFHLKPENR